MIDLTSDVRELNNHIRHQKGIYLNDYYYLLERGGKTTIIIGFQTSDCCRHLKWSFLQAR